MNTVIETALNPYIELANFEASLKKGSYGASCIFIGTARDFNLNEKVTSLNIEHYPGMTEKKLIEIASKATTQWNLVNTLIIHRVGDITAGDAIVLCATWSTHRQEAFESCRFLIEELKYKAPFWKKETLEDTSERWVSSNTPVA